MTRLRSFLLIFAWAGLVWMVFHEANEGKISDNFIIDLTYNATAILIAVAMAAGAAIFARTHLGASSLLTIILVAVLIVSLAALEVFWLRDFFTQP